MEIYAPKGLVVWIHNHSTPPKRLFKNNHNGDIGFASTGYETHFIVEKTVDTKLEEPYNKCFKDVCTCLSCFHLLYWVLLTLLHYI